jgi:O-antigen/teichoic acid export membrane protein
LALSKFKPEIAQGFSFSISSSSLTAYNDIDKTLLARLSTLEATGIYAAAYRFINIAFVPTHSLLVASYPVFFRRGAVGIGGSLSFAKRLAPPVIVYSCVVVIGLLILAPVAPYILGNEYNLAVEAIRWLAPIPFLSAMHYLAGDILTGAGSQGVRSGIQIMAALFNVAMNLWLIPMYSWKGAAWSSLASEALLALSLWGVIFFYRRRQNSR